MARNAEARMPSDEQRAAHVRKTRMANYHASMRLEGFYVEEGAKMSNKKDFDQEIQKAGHEVCLISMASATTATAMKTQMF